MTTTAPRRFLQIRLSWLMVLVAVSGVIALGLLRGPAWVERAKAYRVNRPILQRLDRAIPADATPPATLFEALELVQAATADVGMPTGVMIYVDPIGLLEAETRPNAPVKVRIEGMTARDLLRESLEPLGLDYQVKAGLLTVSHRQAMDIGNESFR